MAIPEFILKKLIVPGSFKTSSNGFTFKILNTFAPATITRFNIMVGKTIVPEENVTISSDIQLAMPGNLISFENPLELPVGLVIRIDVQATAGQDQVRLTAATKEVGEIGVTLNQGESRSIRNKFRAGFLTHFQSPRTAEIKINLEKCVAEASPFILGQFIEHLERCIYDGIWTADGRELREDTLDLIRQLNPPLIRYPGGNFASGYHWEDGIGPQKTRPPRHDAAWQAEETNQVGTDEFLRFCEEIGTVPLLVVNDGSGTPEEAARWVSYCNSPQDTEQGMRRADNGHPEPYNVKYWGIGNEVWGPWQIGTTTGEEYCRRARRFIESMKAVDPSIKLVIVGHSPFSENREDVGYAWNETVLRELGDHIDFISWHIYQPDKEDWKEAYDPQDLYFSVNSAHLDIEEIITRVENQINHNKSGRKILQAVDEWNLWLPPCKKNVSMHCVTYTMRDSLYAASVLMTFFKHAQTIGMANLAQLVNVLPLIQTNDNSAISTAMFFPFILFRQMQPFVVESSVICETFNSKRQSYNLDAHENVPYIDSLITSNEDYSKITVILLNRYPFHRAKISFDVDFADDEICPSQAMQIHAPTPESFNSFSKPDRVKISDADLPVIKNGRFHLRLKPCSIYFAEIDIKHRQH